MGEADGWRLDSEELAESGVRLLPSMIVKSKMGKHYDIVLSSILSTGLGPRIFLLLSWNPPMTTNSSCPPSPLHI